MTAQHDPTTWPEILTAIFARQAELMEKWRVIEQLPAAPVSVHHPHGQRVLKDFAWRTIEEMTEAYQAAIEGGELAVSAAIVHEELADALHFLVELLIFAGVSASHVIADEPNYPALGYAYETLPTNHWWRSTYELGLAMHLLKNRPWKTAQVPTDEGRFRRQLLAAFQAHLRVWAALEIRMEDMHAAYFAKSSINAARQGGKT